jgi:hypothetical protein
MMMQTMVQVTMLVQVMGDGGVYDITSLSNDESHKE